ncbi:MAG: hypothetical protein IJI14_17820 [Anaerolineaceae bacterium]|nr:hypothetical protein [Anaerolineaceae bacterium]
MNIFTKENKDQFVQLFTKYGCNTPIETIGVELECKSEIDVNFSDIFTRLIQEAGRYCEHYASDLYYSLRSIDDSLRDASIGTHSQLFGFREMGMDSTSFIMSAAEEDYCNFSYRYRSIWRLDVEVMYDPEYWYHKGRKSVKMKLYRVNAPSSWKLKKFIEEIKKEAEEAEKAAE